MKKLLTEKFGDWKKGDAAAVPPPPVPGVAKPRLVFAPKEDVTQTGIIISHLGFRADDPDYAAMTVFEMALGGGFQSRLVNKIRTERGLAYAAGAAAGADYARPGVFLAYSLTRNDSALTALDLLRQETAKVTEAPFTDAELKAAKESVVNGLVFSFAEPSAILFRSSYYELTGYPLDFLERYQKALEGVNATTVLEAAKRKIHPDRFVAIVVGKEKEFEKPLESMGLPLERVDISIPAPASKVAAGEATPEALAKGQALLTKAAGLAGGSAAWAAIKSISVERDGDRQHAGADHGHDQRHPLAPARPLRRHAQARHGRDRTGLRRHQRLDGRHGPGAGPAQGGRGDQEEVRALALPAVRRARRVPGAGPGRAEDRGRRDLQRWRW